MYKSAFSLIELLVVIAIVAALSAIAVPAYKQYGLRSKAMAILPALQNYIERERTYHSINGRFGTPADLGFAVGVGGGMVNSNIPYIDGNLSMIPNSACFPGQRSVYVSSSYDIDGTR